MFTRTNGTRSTIMSCARITVWCGTLGSLKLDQRSRVNTGDGISGRERTYNSEGPHVNTSPNTIKNKKFGKRLHSETVSSDESDRSEPTYHKVEQTEAKVEDDSDEVDFSQPKTSNYQADAQRRRSGTSPVSDSEECRSHRGKKQRRG
jgi:hypothetical protein